MEKQEYKGKPTPDEVASYIRDTFAITVNALQRNKEKRYVIAIKKGKQTVKYSDFRYILKRENYWLSESMTLDILESELPDIKVSEVSKDLKSILSGFKYKGTPVLDKFVSCIVARDFGDAPEGYYQQRAEKHIKKWLVATHATAITNVKNPTVLVLTEHKGGAGKTPLLEKLVQHIPLNYYHKAIEKQQKLNIADIRDKVWLYNFDEFILSDNKYDTLKGETTHQIDVNRTINYCASTNHNGEGHREGFIKKYDPAFMKRLATVELTSINWATINQISIEQLHAECMVLIKNSEYNYQYDETDFADYRLYNMRYLDKIDLSRIILEHFQVPDNPTEHTIIRPSQVAEYLQKIGFVYANASLVGHQMKRIFEPAPRDAVGSRYYGVKI